MPPTTSIAIANRLPTDNEIEEGSGILLAWCDNGVWIVAEPGSLAVGP